MDDELHPEGRAFVAQLEDSQLPVTGHFGSVDADS
jgi:hypothetical protein